MHFKCTMLEEVHIEKILELDKEEFLQQLSGFVLTEPFG